MKLFSISSRDTSMDAMFYIQASTKQQASYIFSTLSPKPTANCQ
ncbi:flavin reductase, partial [Salmonella enterica]|nr:flavin reductase [Salmonella enterica]